MSKAEIIKYSEFTTLPYQMIKPMTAAMTKEKAEDFLLQTEEAIVTLNRRLSEAAISVAESQRIFSGIKKLEIIYGYLFDKVKGTDFYNPPKKQPETSCQERRAI